VTSVTYTVLVFWGFSLFLGARCCKQNQGEKVINAKSKTVLELKEKRRQLARETYMNFM